jgi:hypothetical protein
MFAAEIRTRINNLYSHPGVQDPRCLMMPSKRKAKILIEVVYKAGYCLPCIYMEQMVQEVLPSYNDRVAYRRIDIMRGEGKKRFLEISYALFGKDGVHKNLRLAPVPSLWINGELFFDAIPARFELEEAIEEILNEDRNPQKKRGDP